MVLVTSSVREARMPPDQPYRCKPTQVVPVDKHKCKLPSPGSLYITHTLHVDAISCISCRDTSHSEAGIGRQRQWEIFANRALALRYALPVGT